MPPASGQQEPSGWCGGEAKPVWPLTHPMPRRSDLASQFLLLVQGRSDRPGLRIRFIPAPRALARPLRGMRVSRGVVNSNPASFMNRSGDGGSHLHRPAHPDVVVRQGDRTGAPDACGPPMGGQTACNPGGGPAEAAPLRRFGVELIGANLQAIRRRKGTGACSRRRWSASAWRCCPSGIASLAAGSRAGGEEIGTYPAFIRAGLHPRAAPVAGHRLQPREFQAFLQERLRGSRSARS